jgi:MFS family permease
VDGSTRLLRSLRHANYRRYYAGQLVSLSGTWMQHTAQAWLVYRLTESSFWLGMVAFTGMLPILLLAIPAGHLADRFSRYRLLVIAHSLALVQALLLGVLALSGVITVTGVLLLAMLLGASQALEMPTRHSLIPMLVPREDLPNAIALNTGLFNVSRFIGPAVAGALLAVVDEGWVFLVNAASFLAILAALWRMDRSLLATPGSGRRTGEGFWAGPRHVLGDASLRRVVKIVLTVSLLGIPFSVLLPVVAREIYAGGPGLLGWLMAANGAGAFVAAVWLAMRGRSGGLDRVVGVAALLAGSALLLFANSTRPAAGIALLALAGFAFTTLVASCNTRVQVQIPDRLRGRVMAFYSVLFVGMFPLGQLLAGSLAVWLGVRPVIALFGACVFGAGVLYLVTGRAAARAGAV